MSLVKRILRKFKFSSNLLETYFLSKKYLKPKGWLSSRFLYEPVDGDGNPIPWITYSSLHFISQKLENTSFKVFEYGSGNSTIWFAERAENVVSVEHASEFYEKIKKKLNSYSNVTYLFADLKDGYSEKIVAYTNEFHIVVIDGRDRIACTKNSLKSLRDDGIIIWDNSDRDKYKEAYDYLAANNFKKIEFKGLGAIGHVEWQTSIFYRENNCFNI